MADDIKKRGDTYLVRYYDLSGRRVSRTCPDLRTARQLKREVESAKALGREWEPSGLRAGTHTPLADVVRVYLTESARRWRPQTLQGRAYVLGYFLEWMNGTATAPTLGALTTTTFSAWYTSMVNLAESTRQMRTRIGLDLWRWAFDSEEYGAVTSRPRRFDLPTVDHTPAIAPTWAECDAVIAELAGSHPGRPPVVALRLATLMRYTGLRVGQVARLTWEDFDLAEQTLRIRGELGKSRQERAGRIIPIAPGLAQAMAGWGVRSGPLFSPTGKVTAIGRIRRAWTELSDPEREGGPALRAAAFAGQTDHAFRKAFVTELRRAGAETDAVEFLVGHSTGIRAHYLDADALPLRAAVALIRPVGIRGGSENVIELRKHQSFPLDAAHVRPSKETKI